MLDYLDGADSHPDQTLVWAICVVALGLLGFAPPWQRRPDDDDDDTTEA